MEIDKNALLNKYYSLFNNREWEKAEKILLKLLENEPDNFWLLTSISSLKYEMKKYEESREYSVLAYKLNPNSPLVLWDYAGVLFMLDEEEIAIEHLTKIIDMGEIKVAFEETTEGLKWAKSIINDSYFKIGQAHFYLNNLDKAKTFILIHLNNRKRGLKSLFKKIYVLNLLKDVGNELNEN